jgi:hypothetical protein
VPDALVTLDALPLNVNGKVDRDGLPEPSGRVEPASAFVAPRGPIEELVAEVWAEVLAVRPVGADDDFYELGGNSLAAARVASHLLARGLSIPLRVMFDEPTVAAVARHVLADLAADADADTDAAGSTAGESW